MGTASPRDCLSFGVDGSHLHTAKPHRAVGTSDPAASIYLDYNATTPLHPSVIACITDSLRNSWQNPSSAYTACETIRFKIAKARRQIGYALGLLPESAVDEISMWNACTLGKGDATSSFVPESIIFTSGGTESNNWAIDIAIKHAIKNSPPGHSCHIITTTVEHDSICRKLKEGTDHYRIPVEVTYIQPSTTLPGTFDVEDFISTIRDETCLITCIYAQNETGIIQPVELLAEKLEEINKRRRLRNLQPVLFHTDASQVIGKLAINLTELAGIDMLTVCGHKFQGPRIGALFLRPNTALRAAEPFIYGGLSQEFGLRSGTQNTPMIVGLGEAAFLATRELDARTHHMLAMKELLLEKLRLISSSQSSIQCERQFPVSPPEEFYIWNSKSILNVNFDVSNGCNILPNTLSVAFPALWNDDDVELEPPSQNLQQRLARRGVLCSTGSACHAGACKASQVLLESGVSKQDALTTLRLSVGPSTTADEVLEAAEIIVQEVSSMIKLKN